MFEILSCLALIMICIIVVSWSVNYITTAYQVLEKDYQAVFLMARSLEYNVLEADEFLSFSNQKIFFLNNQMVGKAHIVIKEDFFLWKYDNEI